MRTLAVICFLATFFSIFTLPLNILSLICSLYHIYLTPMTQNFSYLLFHKTSISDLQSTVSLLDVMKLSEYKSIKSGISSYWSYSENIKIINPTFICLLLIPSPFAKNLGFFFYSAIFFQANLLHLQFLLLPYS